MHVTESMQHSRAPEIENDLDHENLNVPKLLQVHVTKII